MADTLRSKMIRLAASFPKGSDERKALLNVMASTRLDADVMDTMRRIHEDRRVRHGWDRDVSRAFTALDNAGEGYGVGEETDEIDGISEAGRLIDTVDHGQIAVYWNPRHLTLVADKYGPWAVDVSVSRL